MNGSLIREVAVLSLPYARHGWKKYRVLTFAKYFAKQRCKNLVQVGNRHVHRFFADHEWANSTRYGYVLALKELFSLAGTNVDIVSR